MLHVIGGLAQATRGKVLLDGNDLTTMTDAARTMLRRHKVGFVFQRFNLLPTLDAYHNIVLAQQYLRRRIRPPPLRGCRESTRNQRTLKHKSSEMSGGNSSESQLRERLIICENQRSC